MKLNTIFTCLLTLRRPKEKSGPGRENNTVDLRLSHADSGYNDNIIISVDGRDRTNESSPERFNFDAKI